MRKKIQEASSFASTNADWLIILAWVKASVTKEIHFSALLILCEYISFGNFTGENGWSSTGFGS